MTHPLAQMTISIGAPEEVDGKEGRRVLAAFYGDLLGMQIISEDWLRIAKSRESKLRFALDGDGWSDQRPPRWQDPERPQQMHVDIAVADVARAGEMVTDMGGSLREEHADHRTYADPVGHPFCLYSDPAHAADGPSVVRLVVDCFSPRALASFYEGLLGVRERLVDTPDRVEIDLEDDALPNFGFQHAQFVAARWPDPAYPAQLHVDFRFADGIETACERAERLGGIRLPKLSDTETYADPAGHPFCL